jgi:RNA polymerase sigma factor (sigma-70 family)
MDSVAPSDVARLTERIRSGEGAADEELANRFHEKAFLMALARTRDREAARDLAQETMLVVLRAVREGRVLDAGRLAGYVCGTARNLVREHLRSRQPRTDPVDPEPPPVPDPEQEAVQSERQFLVRRVLRSLHEPDRLVLLLTLVDGLAPAEIAERLGIRPDAVRQRKTRALQRARAVLEEMSRTSPETHVVQRAD